MKKLSKMFKNKLVTVLMTIVLTGVSISTIAIDRSEIFPTADENEETEKGWVLHVLVHILDLLFAPEEIAPDGCHMDSDRDGTVDCYDIFPFDPFYSEYWDGISEPRQGDIWIVTTCEGSYCYDVVFVWHDGEWVEP